MFQTFREKTVDFHCKSKKLFRLVDRKLLARQASNKRDEFPSTNQSHEYSIIGGNDIFHSLGLGRMYSTAPQNSENHTDLSSHLSRVIFDKLAITKLKIRVA